MSFADNLRAAMKRANVSQSELARRLGIHSQAVNQWLKPGGTAPRGARLVEIAEAIGVELSALLAEPRKGRRGPDDQRLGAIVAAYATMDETNRETLARVALSMTRDASPGAPLAGQIVKRTSEQAWIDLWRGMDDAERAEAIQMLDISGVQRARA